MLVPPFFAGGAKLVVIQVALPVRFGAGALLFECLHATENGERLWRDFLCHRYSAAGSSPLPFGGSSFKFSSRTARTNAVRLSRSIATSGMARCMPLSSV